MVSVNGAVRTWRRPSIVGPRRVPQRLTLAPVGRVAVPAIAALVALAASAAPGYVSASSRAAASAAATLRGVADMPHAHSVAVAVALTVAALIAFASAATFLTCRLRSTARPGRAVRLALWGALAGGVVGMSLTAVRGTLGAVAVGALGAAVVAIACSAAAFVGGRRPAVTRPGGPVRRQRRLEIAVAAGLVLAAVVVRHVGPVDAVLVPVLVALAIAVAAGAMLGPVATWFGRHLVRAAEAATRSKLDARSDVTVLVGAEPEDGPDCEHASDEHPSDLDTQPSRFLRAGIAATAYLGRRPGVDRVVALAVIAVVAAGAASFGWMSAYGARHDRAVMDLGADRVLTVASLPAAQLMADVRAADPTGRYAMAAVSIAGSTANPPVVAIDSGRLGAIDPTAVHGAASGDHTATLIRPKRSVPTTISGTALQLNASATGDLMSPTFIIALLDMPDGVTRGTAFGPLRAGEHVYASAASCAAGCTLRGFTVTADGHGAGRPLPQRDEIVMRELRQNSPDLTVLSTASFGDATRWRLESGPTPVRATVGESDVGLAVTVGVSAGLSGGATISLDDGISVPAVTGPAPPRPGIIASAVAVRPIRMSTPPPGVPAGGLLVDLDAVLRDAGDAMIGGTSEVWLAADAPPSIVAALQHEGLTVIRDVTVGDLAQAYGQLPAIAIVRFQLLTGMVAVWCAAFLIGAAIRAHRGRRTVIRGLGLSGTAWLVGLGGAIVARHAGPDPARFTDGWRLLDPPPLVGAGMFATYAVVTAAVLGVATLVAARMSRTPAGVIRPPDTVPATPAVPDRRDDTSAAGPHPVSR